MDTDTPGEFKVDPSPAGDRIIVELGACRASIDVRRIDYLIEALRKAEQDCIILASKSTALCTTRDVRMVESCQFFEGIDENSFAIAFLHKNGEVTRLGFANDSAVLLMGALQRSQDKLAAKRSVPRH